MPIKITCRTKGSLWMFRVTGILNRMQQFSNVISTDQVCSGIFHRELHNMVENSETILICSQRQGQEWKTEISLLPPLPFCPVIVSKHTVRNTPVPVGAGQGCRANSPSLSAHSTVCVCGGGGGGLIFLGTLHILSLLIWFPFLHIRWLRLRYIMIILIEIGHSVW